MSKRFFEGVTYLKGDFKGLMPRYYPEKYKKYVKEEVFLLKKKINGANKVLEAGVGIGRLIPELSPIVKEFIGIDNSQFMLKKSELVANNYKNVKIFDLEIEKLNEKFPEKYFDYSLCVWNTLGNVKSEVNVLIELNKVTKYSIFITVFHKGTIKDRLDFYKHVDVDVQKIDEKKEIFYLKGYKSKTFNLEDIKKIAEKAGLKVKDSKVLGEVILWVELVNKN